MCVKVCLICFLKLLYLELKHNFQNHCLSYHIRISRYVFLIGVDNVYQSQHQNDGRLYTQLFVWGCMSYLWYFGMFTYRGVQYGLTIWVTWCLIRGRNCFITLKYLKARKSGIFKLFFISYPMKECQIINKRYRKPKIQSWIDSSDTVVTLITQNKGRR
jgi:hypothetical protein